MSAGTTKIKIGDEGAHIALDWGTDELELCTVGDDGFPAPAVFGLDELDQLLDALHKARADVAGTKRVPRILRLPVRLRDALEAKSRREDIAQNAIIIQAIDEFLSR